MLATALGAVLVVALFSISDRSGDVQVDLPEQQEMFLERVDTFRTEADKALNSLALKEVLRRRNEEISSFSVAKNWKGTIVGIHSMRSKGAIGIDLGGAELVAGVHERYDLNSLVDQSTPLYDEILLMERGDTVVFSGNFQLFGGRIVQLNNFDKDALNAPRFLFHFSEIRKMD